MKQVIRTTEFLCYNRFILNSTSVHFWHLKISNLHKIFPLFSSIFLKFYKTMLFISKSDSFRGFIFPTNYGHPKLSSLHGRKSNPKFLGTAEAYFVYHICPNFWFMPSLGVRGPWFSPMADMETFLSAEYLIQAFGLIL